ncbi:MarR family winged helix-turn-helix transcriptional regulator [Plantibacter sp. YIM 135347]|uniref:MarR family winged helix-turn-helix transcriptional regulator n=1 Tax=Plantibacter sp. YIM 135347 TaxID=3423919 RepID=UPI003D34F34F
MPVDLEHLGRSVKRVQDRDHRALDTALRTIGISLVQWDALKAIDRNPGASAHDLAVATFQSDQAFGTLATRLITAGWVDRSPGDGRRLHHRLTEDGQSILAEGRTLARGVWEELFAPLDDDEQRALAALLEKLVG